jgi:hypothetical protein
MDGFHPRHIPIIHHGTRDKATITSAPILICKSVCDQRLGICSRGSPFASGCYLWVGYAPLPMFADMVNLVRLEGWYF